jgi:catechol 2,3-dioxygenase-like lactoylglutathione lyase family enzyme
MAAASSFERAMLDHVTLRTHDLEGTRAFFEAVLGLKPGYRPAFGFSGYWLYADGEPVVHLIPGHGRPVDRAGEMIDHVAFRLTDHDGMRRKLDDLAIPYSRMELPELGERRLFIRTPTGILLELVFREARADPSNQTTDVEKIHVE